jgi:hypothetical protein
MTHHPAYLTETTDLAPDFFARLFPGDPLVVTMFDYADLKQKPQRGRVWLSSWPWLIRFTESPAVDADKAGPGGFAFADLRDGIRRRDSVKTVSCLVIDHDAGTVPARQACADLNRYRRIVHTTASHTIERPRWRAYVATSRPMSVEEYSQLWPLAAGAMQSAGIPIDASAKDPCRLWYSPSVKAFGSAWEHYSENGAPIDVDKMLARAAEIDAEEAAERARRCRPVEPHHRDRYAAGALKRAADAVADATPGERHGKVFDEAFALARDELGLEEHEIRQALAPAFVHAAGQARAYEGERTIADAIRARRKGS